MSLHAIHATSKVERSGDVTIITIRGGNIRDVENVLARDLEGLTDGLAANHLLLDFTHVEFLSSVELGTLIGLHKKQEACGGRLTLFNLSAPIFELFTLTRLHTFLGICREEALAGQD